MGFPDSHCVLLLSWLLSDLVSQATVPVQRDRFGESGGELVSLVASLAALLLRNRLLHGFPPPLAPRPPVQVQIQQLVEMVMTGGCPGFWVLIVVLPWRL